MAKPRNSVLYMFDPLHQAPCTPQRDSSSPELGPSDKENDAPGELTVFFSRTYGAHKSSVEDVQPPRTPKGKLIDIGDTPAPAARFWDHHHYQPGETHDGSDADGEQSESDVEGCAVAAAAATTTALSPRVPLADLSLGLDQTPRPQAQSKDAGQPFRTLIFADAASPSAPPLSALLELEPAPQTSALAGVVNSINFADDDDNSEEREDEAVRSPCLLREAASLGRGGAGEGRSSSPFPEINVCPETPVVGAFEFASPHISAHDRDGFGGKEDEDEGQQLVPMTMTARATATHLRPPTTLTQLSPDDPRRASVDLYSSFHLQMQSEDMSFDLLNDKISFLGGAQDSFWAGADDGLEFDEVSVPVAMMAKLDALVPVAKKHGENDRVPSPPTEVSQEPEFEVDSVMSPTTEAAINVPLPMSPTASAPPSRNGKKLLLLCCVLHR